eukprot:11370493-Alexandrium_andersonii.AAC.1
MCIRDRIIIIHLPEMLRPHPPIHPDPPRSASGAPAGLLHSHIWRLRWKQRKTHLSRALWVYSEGVTGLA